MTTKNTGKIAATRSSQVVDRRKIAVGKKVEIGGKNGTVVSDEKIETKDVYADRLFVDYNGKQTNILDLIGGGTIEVKDPKNKIFADVSKIKFQGSGVSITQNAKGSIIITITGGGSSDPDSPDEPITPTEYAGLGSMEINDFPLEKKYIFGTDRYTYSLPDGYNAGDAFDKCHGVQQEIQFVFTAEDGGRFGFDNLETILTVTLTQGTQTKDYTVTLNGLQNDNTIWTFTNYIIENGAISFENIKFKLPLKDLGVGGAWALSVTTSDSETVLESDQYFAYTVQTPKYDTSSTPIIKNTYYETRIDEWTSGIKLLPKTPTGLSISIVPFTNSVHMISNATFENGNLERGKIIVEGSQSGTHRSQSILGSVSDTESTVIEGTYNFRLNEFDSTDTSFVVTQQFSGIDDTAVSTHQLGSGGEVIPDTNRIAYFYREDGEYPRLLASFTDRTTYQMLTFGESDGLYDSTHPVVRPADQTEGTNNDELYYNQAVVYDGKLIHPANPLLTSVENVPENYASDNHLPKIYVRKFVVDPDDYSNLDLFAVRIGGFGEHYENRDTADFVDDRQAWLFVRNSANRLVSARINLPLGTGKGICKNQENDVFYLDTEGAVLPSGILKNTQLYLVIVFKSVSAEIQGPIEFLQ